MRTTDTNKTVVKDFVDGLCYAGLDTDELRSQTLARLKGLLSQHTVQEHVRASYDKVGCG